MGLFEEEYPSLESYWRSIILFGKNAASYKFALAQTLLDVVKENKSKFMLDELALPFTKNICDHIKHVDKQSTSQTSRFLDACRNYNSSKLSHEELIEVTTKLGFNNVLDAFHIVNNDEIPIKFFEVEGEGAKRKVYLTDDLYKLLETGQHNNFSLETEARWRLVETAWSLSIPSCLFQVKYDSDKGLFYMDNNKFRRVDVTAARDALNGYQKGKCFYCFSDISINPSLDDLGDVDHFFPYVLQSEIKANLNGIWNLVLSCKSCNRGIHGKFAKIPHIRYLERLHKRNSYFIDSHHPLRETLINQTGVSESTRRKFLIDVDKASINILIHRWESEKELGPVF